MTDSNSHPPLETPQIFHGSRWDTAIVSAAVGILGGIAIGLTVASSSLSKTISLATAAAGAGATGTYLVLDYRQTTRRNQLQAQINQFKDEQAQQQRELEKLAADRAKLYQALKQAELLLQEQTQREAIDVAQLKASLDESATALKKDLQTQTQTATKASVLQTQINALQAEISQLQHDRTELIDRISDMVESADAEVEQRAEQVATVRLQALRQNEIKRVADEYEGLAIKLFALFDRLEKWGANIKDSHDAKSNIIRGLAGEYCGKIGEFQTQITDETDAYLKQIEILRERLGIAYATNAGEILTVQPKDFGYSPEGAIVNEIAVWVSSKLNIPLAVRGMHVRDSGVIEAGYSYSVSANPAAIVEAILQAREQCARNLGIYKLEAVKKLEITDCLSIAFRRERPAARAEKGSLYRSREDFVKLLMSSRLFFRFVGSPGKGKTPSVMVILSHLLKRGFLSGNVPEGKKLEYTAIDLCNSLEDISVKNTATETAVFHRWSDPKQALRDLKVESQFRREPENKTYRESVGYVWVCDEFDNAVAEMKPVELKGFMKLLKEGGHVNMGAIVMGQAVMASTSNFKIEDQKFLLNILLDSTAIRTFLKEYGEKFYAPKAIETALNTLEQIEAEIEDTNEFICDTARQLRIAMVVADRSPVFYQLPYFDGVEIDLPAYADTRRQIQDIRAGRKLSASSLSVSAEAETLLDTGTSEETDAARRLPMSPVATVADRPSCPHCGSSKVRSKADKWLCEDPAHNDRAEGKPKSWKKA